MFSPKFSKRRALLLSLFVVVFMIWYRNTIIVDVCIRASTITKNPIIKVVTPTVFREAKPIRDVSICNVSHFVFVPKFNNDKKIRCWHIFCMFA